MVWDQGEGLSRTMLGGRALEVSNKTAPAYLPLAVELICHVGEPGYLACVTHSLSNVVDFAHIAIMTFVAAAPPSLLGTDSTQSREVARDTAYVYLQGHYINDPTATLRTRAADTRKFLFAQRQRDQDIRNRGYRTSCYETAGIIDRMSLIQRYGAQAWVAVNIYRDSSQGYFDSSECMRLVTVAPMLTASADKHRRLLLGQADRQSNIDGSFPAGEIFQRRLAAVGSKLSKRELEVCSHILGGFTAKEIARRLGIAPTSVVSHRQNAYRKLTIRDHKQLFALVLAH